MRTITFYSYKGGVGRSLLVANATKYLSILDKKVLAIDLDLEAPGLHYKFELESETPPSAPMPGMVDVLAEFRAHGRMPESLRPYITQVNVPGAREVHVMRAGKAPLGEYWRTLANLDWSELFYGPKGIGSLFFLELRERIRREFNPDFLLIDARTGITEMGGVATTLLPDTVVCLALNSAEHLEGLRAVMQGIRQTTQNSGIAVNLLAVISRLSPRGDSSAEDAELDSIRSFLNSPISQNGARLNLEEVVALHSEPALELRERLLVGGKNSPYELPLLRDYLKLFSKIIPAEEIRPHIGRLVQVAVSRVLDDPDGAQSDLEALTTYCADQEAFRALLKLYQLRKEPIEKMLETASLMWQFRASGSKPDQFVLGIVKAAYEERRATDAQEKYAEFAEDVWRHTGMSDVRLGLALSNAYLPNRRGRAIRLLSDYIDKAEIPSYPAISRLIQMLSDEEREEEAFSVVERFKANADFLGFYVAWAKLVVEQNEADAAQKVLLDPFFRVEALRRAEPGTLYRLLKLSGDSTGARSVLDQALEIAVSEESLYKLRDLGEIFALEGQFDEFTSRIQGRVSERFVKELSELVMLRDPRHRRLRYSDPADRSMLLGRSARP